MSEPITDELSTGETDPPAPVPDDEPEPDNPDAEPLEAIEPPDEPDESDADLPPSEPSSLALSEEQEKKLRAEVKRHTARVTEYLGDAAAEAIVCPFCNPELQGFLYAGDLEHPRDEMQERLFGVLREPAQAEFEAARDVETCSQCKGYGKTATGSKVPGNDTKVCKNCVGYGYYPPPTLGQNGAVGADAEHALALVGAPPPVVDDADAWGSPRLLPDGQENPNYGRMPQYKNADLP